MKKFNINCPVNIRLTETGIAILKDNYDNMLKAHADKPEVLEMLGEFKVPEMDENGYTQMELWKVMAAFGSYLNYGATNPPFELDITISDEYLKDPENVKSL